ncbi:MAG: hypothetical protein ACRDKZ_09460 [Actinomycetota bacterium]
MLVGMWLMWILALVVASGLVVGLASGDQPISRPWSPADPRRVPWAEVIRRYIWYVALALGAGILSGIVMIGAGGRLAMRILAATAGDEAQGRITEADEIVGVVSVDGTLGFVIFLGLLGGIVTGALFVLLHGLLPPGRWRGLTFGALLLVIGATRLDPLRPENPDFDIVGPGWLAVLVFVAMGLGYGLLLAALAGIYSRALPLISLRPKALVLYAPCLILIPGFLFLVPVVVGGVLALLLSRVPQEWTRDTDRIRVTGRIVLGLIAVVALPGFISGVVDIAGRT